MNSGTKKNYEEIILRPIKHRKLWRTMISHCPEETGKRERENVLENFEQINDVAKRKRGIIKE